MWFQTLDYYIPLLSLFSPVFLNQWTQSCKSGRFFTCIGSLATSCWAQAKEWDQVWLSSNQIIELTCYSQWIFWLTCSSSLLLLIYVYFWFLKCRQQDLLKKVIEIKPKRHKVSSSSDGNQSHPNLIVSASTNLESENDQVKDKVHVSSSHRIKGESEGKTTAKSLLGLAYASSDNEED